MNQSIEFNTPAQVEQTLAAYGCWDVVNFLLTCNILKQEGYEAWRVGEHGCLEDALKVDLQYLFQLLDTAFAHARNLGLDQTSVEWNGWGDMGGKTLRLFHNDKYQQQFLMRLSPKRDRPQLDLFMDTSRNVLLNQIRTALLERSADLDSLFDRAFEEDPNDGELINLDVVRAVMQAQEVGNPIQWQNRLEKTIEPIVRELFPYRADDILAPLWRRMARAVEHLPFEPRFANFHASVAWFRARAWEQTLKSIENSPAWVQYPVLHQRRIAALIAMHEESRVRGACFDICWHCSDHAEETFSSLDLCNCGLDRLWQSFLHLAHEPEAEIFPVWIKLGNAGSLAVQFSDSSDETKGRKLFDLATELVISEAEKGEDMELRHQLKEYNPWLLQVYLSSKY
jgi:hypothetical protein